MRGALSPWELKIAIQYKMNRNKAPGAMLGPMPLLDGFVLPELHESPSITNPTASIDRNSSPDITSYLGISAHFLFEMVNR